MKPRAMVAVILIEGKINLHMNFPSNHLQDHTLVNSAIKINNEKTKSERAKAPINCWDTVDVLHRCLVTAIRFVDFLSNSAIQFDDRMSCCIVTKE